MSAYLYDEALVRNLREVIGDDRITITPIDNVMNVIPRLNDDTLTLPLVTLTRTSWSIQASEANHFNKYEGPIVKEEYSDRMDRFNIQRVQFVPMSISYAIDVWTKTRQENDEFIRELFWYYMTSPTLQITVPYTLDIDHNFNVFLSNEIEDNSDIAQHVDRGEYFRQTLQLYTDDAKLWKSASRGPTYVDIHTVIDRENIEEASKNLSSFSTIQEGTDA